MVHQHIQKASNGFNEANLLKSGSGQQYMIVCLVTFTESFTEPRPRI
jgi:hypothetical protein